MVKDITIFSFKIIFHLLIFCEKQWQSICSCIFFAPSIIIKMILKRYLCLIDLFETHIFYIHKIRKIEMILFNNFESCFANKRAKKLKKQINICKQIWFHTKKLKKTNNKSLKLQSYALGKKVWLNSKYSKIKQNQKPKVKFFGPFQILYLIGK